MFVRIFLEDFVRLLDKILFFNSTEILSIKSLIFDQFLLSFGRKIRSIKALLSSSL